MGLLPIQIADMIMHMRTTLILPDHLVRELRRRAAQQGATLTAVVAETLRRGLDTLAPAEVQPLPRHDLGAALVDVSDRDALYRAMDGV